MRAFPLSSASRTAGAPGGRARPDVTRRSAPSLVLQGSDHSSASLGRLPPPGFQLCRLRGVYIGGCG